MAEEKGLPPVREPVDMTDLPLSAHPLIVIQLDPNPPKRYERAPKRER